MNEIVPLNRFLRTKLRADATISAAVSARVFVAIAPAKDPATGSAPAFPYLVIWNILRESWLKVGGTKHGGRAIYGVKAVGTNEDSLEEVASAITTTLEASTGTQSGVRVLSITCDPVSLPQQIEVTGTGRIVHVGDRFRIFWEEV